MSLHLDYAEISRQARRIVDANRARTVLMQQQQLEKPVTLCSVTRTCGESQPEVSWNRAHIQQPADDQDPPRKRIKFTRSTKGCLGCRQHKVKCDETLPTCLRCVASQRVCEYPAPRSGGEKKRGSGRKRSESSQQDDCAPPPPGIAGPSGTSNGKRHEQEFPSLSLGQGGGMSNGILSGMTLSAAMKESPKQISPSEIFNITPTAGHSSDVSPPNDQFTTPDLSFLNDLIPDLGATGLSPPNPFFPHTSPTSTLPVNWGPPASMAQPVAPLPQIANLTKSLLMARRTGKGKETVGSEASIEGTPSVNVPPRLAVIDALLHAHAFDDALFEFGPSHRQRALSTAGQQTSTDILSNAFPSPTARTLFHHYCNVTSRILITMGNIGPNPLLAICTPLRLLDTNSAASAAMRMSMLSTSIAHYAHETGQLLYNNQVPAVWADQKAQLKAMSNKFKKAALSNILLSAKSDGSAAQTDTVLAACTLLCIRDVVTADTSWSDNMEFVLNLINKKGGPQAMLNGAEYSFTRRYLLENLAAHDVFSYFTTGKEPQLLGNYDSWWFDSVETSTTRWEWESVERSFGISRAMVDLVARICVLDSHKRRLGISLKGHPDELWDAGQHFIRESHCLLLELDIWGNSLNALPQHFRVTCGDYIYKYMAVVYILGEILEQASDTPRIVAAVGHILELCSEASAMRMCVMLTWPLLIAGCFCLPSVREKVRSLMDAFQSDYAEDLQAARELLEEQWRGIDAGEGRRHWSDVMRKLDKRVLLI